MHTESPALLQLENVGLLRAHTAIIEHRVSTMCICIAVLKTGVLLDHEGPKTKIMIVIVK